MARVFLLGLLLVLAAMALIVNANDQSSDEVLLASVMGEPQQTSDWDSIFSAEDVNGVLVLFNAEKQQLLTNDLLRGQTGFIPASTFKIANGLIALELTVVNDAEDQYLWDKQQHSFKAWNQDHTFASAFKFSVVPIFQRIAADIGKQRMANMLVSLGYGNATMGGELDSFWLEGGLRISAMEQIQFLQRLHAETLPLSLRSQQIMQQVMLTESAEDYAIYAKTGFGNKGEAYIGWWVGWVEKDGSTVFFALNLDLANIQQAHLRQKIVKQILQVEQVI
ncbi:class D beta-lactamase [Shewanella sp. KX20019]|uniref:class D beta-lactamase n=1 Tax=Shewanella sp. KX20019 TaxID=2803864 RepID=UPI0019258AF4|nr:class D beta-lactamase [Shewanella sp. KX20019]QQX80895.1 class D beta-lactamase [Shewanella sp. KX20019]